MHGGASGFAIFIDLIIAVIMIASMWKIFEKAGQPGWAAIIPIFNLYVTLKVAQKPGWWLILFFIPIVNFIMYIITLLAVAEKFSKSVGFAIGMILLPIIFFPILGFGDATYSG
ncbi:MAG: signal peptidase I [Deltaproteobacteria bacterium]|nr:MAG: signal peptidase I [Deltaproteobacteria bacterium]